LKFNPADFWGVKKITVGSKVLVIKDLMNPNSRHIGRTGRVKEIVEIVEGYLYPYLVTFGDYDWEYYKEEELELVK